MVPLQGMAGRWYMSARDAAVTRGPFYRTVRCAAVAARSLALQVLGMLLSDVAELALELEQLGCLSRAGRSSARPLGPIHAGFAFPRARGERAYTPGHAAVLVRTGAQLAPSSS